MKISELRQKNELELSRLMEENLSRLAELRFDLAGGKVKNLKEVRTAKLDIARIKTLQKETKQVKS
ncbi:MAG: 50S ribosomal protein L29 [Candidatus Paceibacterota bacterium]